MFGNDFMNLILSNDEIGHLLEALTTLKPFYEATIQLSGSKYPTISMVHPMFYTLVSFCMPAKNDKDMTTLLKQCLLYYTEHYMKKYFNSNLSMYCAASFLDLRLVLSLFFI